MKNIILLEDVLYGQIPKFHKGQKCRVGDGVAADLIERGHAKIDECEQIVEVKKAEVEAKKAALKKEKTK